MPEECFKIKIDKNSLWWHAGGKILFHDIIKPEVSIVEVTIEDCIKIITVSKNLKGWSWDNPPFVILDFDNSDITDQVFMASKLNYFYQTFIKWPAFVTSAAIVSYIIYTFSTIPR